MGDCILLKKTHKSSAPPVTLVTWADGTDEEIAAMIQAADAGEINLSDYWSIGDERVVHLSAMAEDTTLHYEAHAAQDATFVLMDTGIQSGYVDATDKTVNFVVGMKDCMNEMGYMSWNTTYTNSWDTCLRRAWCNDVFYNAIPSTLRGIFKQFKTKSITAYNDYTIKTSLDYFALFAEKEILERASYGRSEEAAVLTSIDYYKTAANRIKKVNGGENYYYTRSLYYSGYNSYVVVRSTGYVSGDYNPHGISPFGCI